MPKFIFIRHAKKLFDNGKPIDGKKSHDPPLIAGQEKFITEKLKELKKEYGEPVHIYASPFLRTRQTADIVSNFFEYKPVHFDIRLKEFLGWQKPKNTPADLEEITKAYLGGDLLGAEKPINVENRVNDFLKDFEEEDKNLYYVITHGIVISKACKLNGHKKEYFDDFCGAFIGDSKKVIFFE